MIGILDSGMGGIITTRLIQKRWPTEEIVYFGDTARAPYGNKSLETIRDFAKDGAAFLQVRGARLIIVVCHTIAGAAGQHLAAQASVPVIDGIVPAIQRAVDVTRNGRIGLIGSRALIESERYLEIISHLAPRSRLFYTVCPLLVPLINAGRIRKPEAAMAIKNCLHTLKARQIDTLILANPHYSFPVFKRIIQRKIGRRVAVVDIGEALVDKLGDIITVPKYGGRTGDSERRPACWVTDLTAETARMANILYGRDVCLKHLSVAEKEVLS